MNLSSFGFSTIRRTPHLGGSTLSATPRIPGLAEGSAIAEIDGSQSRRLRSLRRFRRNR